MEYFNNILENAIAEVLERHIDEILGQLHINIKYEELEKSMQSQAIKLPEKILNCIEESPEDDEVKIERIHQMLSDSGIRRKNTAKNHNI